ncbi:hypothetical protein KFE98_15080 [bacterium SCSIO 12741]|nr:hypothetical protein KFE98_15080 [bacterium SCSIO 12741]
MSKWILLMCIILWTNMLHSQVKIRALVVGSEFYKEDSLLNRFGLPQNVSINGANKSAVLVDSLLRKVLGVESTLIESKADKPVDDLILQQEIGQLILPDSLSQDSFFYIIYICGHGMTSKYDKRNPLFFPGNSSMSRIYARDNVQLSDSLYDPRSGLGLSLSGISSSYCELGFNGIILGDFCQSYFDKESSIDPFTRMNNSSQKSLQKQRAELSNEYFENYYSSVAEHATTLPASENLLNEHGKIDSEKMMTMIYDPILWKQEGAGTIRNHFSDSNEQNLNKLKLEQAKGFSEQLESIDMVELGKLFVDTMLSALENSSYSFDFNSSLVDELYINRCPVIVSSSPGSTQSVKDNPTKFIPHHKSGRNISKVGPLGRRLFFALTTLDHLDSITVNDFINALMDENLDSETIIPSLYWNGDAGDVKLK